MPTPEVKQPPADAPLERIREAQALVRTGSLEEAERAWREILAECPGCFTAAASLVSLLDARGAREQAECVLRNVLSDAPTAVNIRAAARQWERWEESPRDGAREVRIAVTGSGTLTQFGVHLRIACAQLGLHPHLFVSSFGQWAQELLQPASALHASRPDLISIYLAPCELFPRTLEDITAAPEALHEERQAGLRRLRAILEATQQYSPQATVVLHSFALPDHTPFGILDLRQELGQRERVEGINSELRQLCRSQFPNVVLLDQERVEARFGKERVRDNRVWYLFSIPFSEGFLLCLAAEYTRIMRGCFGLTRKCIVLDLDNTLWGGVVGEDGPEGIKLGGPSAPGNAFHEFQRSLEQLHRRGILLAVCSKNNLEDVLPILDRHPGMVLRREQFAAMRVNWADKATNLREIAKELNLGLDSLVFLDDNPAERALVRHQLPEVLTVELPLDPCHYKQVLQRLEVFETLALTQEDRCRSRLYQDQQARAAFAPTLGVGGSLKEHLTGLEMVVTLGFATPTTLPRIAQLVNKTNQFNLTTRRRTEAQLRELLDGGDWQIVSASVSDRFGDMGLTGVVILHTGGQAWEIDSFLLSCRVLGRGVEDALLTFVAEYARQRGADRLRGVYVPTAKNAQTEGFFPGHQFTLCSGEGSPSLHETRWELDLRSSAAQRQYPEWLRIKVEEPALTAPAGSEEVHGNR